MSPNAQWLPGARRRVQTQPQEQIPKQRSSALVEHALLWDAYEERHMFDSTRNRLTRNILSSSKRKCGMCCSNMYISPKWLPLTVVLVISVALTFSIWLSEDHSLATLPWPWHSFIPASAATNAILITLTGVAYVLLAPHNWRSNTTGRPLMPLRAKYHIYIFWLALNMFWFIAGIRGRDFMKPSWLKQTRVASRASHFSQPVLRLLRLLYGVGMASAWPLLANLFVVLVPVDRSLFLMSGLGLGHEEGVLSHAFCGTAVWVWAAAHAFLTQLPMLAAGLWRLIVLPPWDGFETKATSNFMGLLAFLSLCGLGVTSLARLRRRFFNGFQLLHLLLAPAVLLFGCLHDRKIFWYSMLGAVLYGADLMQRWFLRRCAAVATATVYPLAIRELQSQLLAAAAAGPGRAEAAGGSGIKSVVLRIHTNGTPGCVCGQHVFLKVPSVSRWEWHPYSVAAQDERSFAVVVKATGDWERRLAGLVEREAAAEEQEEGRREAAKGRGAKAAAEGSCCSARLDVVYEGLYGTPDLQAAAIAADRVLLFAGGAGITPVASVLQALVVSLPPQLAPPPQQQHRLHGLAEDVVKATSPVSNVVFGATASGGGAAAAVDAAAGGSDVVSIGVPEAALAAAIGSGARVHLVWAVMYLSDAQPLLPLLRAAAARGWAVDLHCTRPPPEAPAQLAIACRDAAAKRAASEGYGSAPSTTAAGAGKATVAAAAKAKAVAVPWQLHGAACWGVAVLAALLGAVGANLGGTAASTHSCDVAGPGVTDSGTRGRYDNTTEWMASVRAAFVPSVSRPSVGDDGADGGASDGGDGGGGSAWARLLGAVLHGNAAPSVFHCPLSLLPSRQHLRATVVADGILATGKKAAKVARKAAGAGGGAVSLRVCRTWTSVVPELCVKCDPFKPPSSELARVWPCCQARVCFFAAQLAPLLGWVVGVLLGAALGCVVWRWWNAAAAAGRGASRRRLLMPRGQRAGSWFGAPVRSGGAGIAECEAATAGLLSEGGGCGVVRAAAGVGQGMKEDGAGQRAGAAALGMVELPGLEAMLSAGESGRRDGSGVVTIDEGAATSAAAAAIPGVLMESVGTSAKSATTGSVRVHAGRPDVEVYIRAAVAAGSDAGGACGRFGRAAYSDEVLGVVVCGPESLQAAVQAAYQRHMQKAYPESWFRGFSFTT